MKSLFIDSSRKKLSVILYNNDTVEFSSDVESYSKHSNYLMNEIKRGLDLTNTQISDIDNFIVKPLLLMFITYILLFVIFNSKTYLQIILYIIIYFTFSYFNFKLYNIFK